MTTANFSKDKDRLYKAAKEYASIGWPVFVQNYIEDISFHPTTRKNEILAMFKAVRKPLLCISTGAASGLVAVEITDPVGRRNAFKLSQTGLLPETLTAKTGGGYYLLYRYPKNGIVPTVLNIFGPGIHIHSDGSYIQAPPSRNRNNGQVITWLGNMAHKPTTDVHPHLLTNIRERFARAACKESQHD